MDIKHISVHLKYPSLQFLVILQLLLKICVTYVMLEIRYQILVYWYLEWHVVDGNLNSILWNKGKMCCIQSSGHERYPFCLSKKRCGIWSGRWGLGFCSVDSTHGGTEPLLSLSCGVSRDPSPLGIEVVAGVSLCWKSCPTLWCLPRFQLSNDSLAAQAAGEWALMGVWMLVIFYIEGCSLCGVWGVLFWVLCISNQTQRLTGFLWWTSM